MFTQEREGNAKDKRLERNYPVAFSDFGLALLDRTLVKFSTNFLE